MTKIIVINPKEKTVELVEVKKIYPDANYLMGCETFTSAFYFHSGADEHMMIVDDEGLLKEDRYWFRYKGSPRPWCGIAAIIGPTDEDGETLDVTCTVEEIKKKITFDGIYFIQ